MKLLLLACILALTMSAQTSTFHGVSISGTDTPIIANSLDNPSLLGVVYQRLTSNGVNPVTHDVDYSRILSGNLIQPGGSSAPPEGALSMAGNFKARVMRQGTMVSEGEPIGYKILAVLFADGTFYTKATVADVKGFHVDGTLMLDSEVQDTLFQQMYTDIATVKGMGRGLQGKTVEERTLSLSRQRLPNPSHGASVDPMAEGHKRQMAMLLSQLADEDTKSAAIGRLAALPEVVKGE